MVDMANRPNVAVRLRTVELLFRHGSTLLSCLSVIGWRVQAYFA
jgi:hypothetical protein